MRVDGVTSISNGVSSLVFELTSVAWIENGYVRGSTGVPDNMPDVSSSVSPAGSDPWVTRNRYGPMPPSADRMDSYASSSPMVVLPVNATVIVGAGISTSKFVVPPL